MNKQNFTTMLPVYLMIVLTSLLAWYAGLLELWLMSDEYGHGLMVFGMLLLAIYQRRSDYVVHIIERKSANFIIAMLSALLVMVGLLSGIDILAMYGVLGFLVCMIVTYGGLKLLIKMSVPMLILLLLIPLPNPFGPMLTAKLQLISSQLGVFFIRLFGGTVYVEGNVIEMGATSLMVAEACAGLRYLFPLMSLGAIMAFTLQCDRSVKWAVFLMTIPITILLNSLRIAVTGFLTENYGTQHTEGFLHFFEGWVVFVLASVILFLSTMALLKINHQTKGFQKMMQLFDIDWPTVKAFRPYALPSLSAWILVFWLLLALLSAVWLGQRDELIPARSQFSQFPARIGNWIGRPLILTSATESVSAATDYLYMDYTADGQDDATVNLYVAYYDSQKHGNIPHSPKVCMPGDGWKIVDESIVPLYSQTGKQWAANRLVIKKGNVEIISYYWIQQGNVAYTAEYQARLGLIPRSFMQNRTDGALVRIHTTKLTSESVTQTDKRLQAFVFASMDHLDKFVPH